MFIREQKWWWYFVPQRIYTIGFWASHSDLLAKWTMIKSLKIKVIEEQDMGNTRK